MSDTRSIVELDDDTTYQMCFVCGPRNGAGLQTRFRLVGDDVVEARFTPREEHQGYPGLVHGGVMTAVIDETIGRLGMLRNQWVMTAKLEVRFLAPFPLGSTATCTASLERASRRGLQGDARVALDDGTVVAEASGLFVEMPATMRAAAETSVPGFATWFERTSAP